MAATQRERLLDGLVQTVAEHGFTRATISDICRAAGVTRPAFYEQFEGKEDAFLAAHRFGTAVLVKRMTEAYEAEPEWRRAVCAALRTMLHLLAAVPAFAAMVVEIDAVGVAGRRQREQFLQRLRAFFANCPELPGGFAREAVVDAVIGGVYATVYQCIDRRSAAELPSLEGMLSFFCLVPFTSPHEASDWLSGTTAAPVVPLDPDCRLLDAPATPQ
ncbi:TetR/AcrR family transcriptional regulator (plasmid) [Kitasatospora sp. NBC_00070]|uniref:TetR/AcrR family transcriptional regulator n=1 Tax=Kitasatospora sp. NBC_00070 TaxID=2975962 RepID=UPI003249C034